MRWMKGFAFLFFLFGLIIGCSNEKADMKGEQEAVKPSNEQSSEKEGSLDSTVGKPKLAIPKPYNPNVKPVIPKPFVPPKPSLPNVEILQPKKHETIIRIPDKVLFDFDSSQLRQEAYQVLEEIAKSLNHAEGYEVRIEGHTDAKGSESYNRQLSQKRAEAVRKALIERYGVSSDILTAIGLGESQPIAPNDTEENRQKNRRVEIKVQPRS